MVRLVRMIKLYKYAATAQEKTQSLKNVNTADSVVESKEEEMPQESHVGAAMSDLTNRRCVRTRGVVWSCVLL